MKKFIYAFVLLFSLSSCEELLDVLESTGGAIGISQSEASSGLKQALEKGVLTGTSFLGQDGGFLKNATYKILMPDEVQNAVSKIKGNPMTIVGDTFPAGTLSGAPKYKAMELIDRYENQSRGFYGGAVGIIGLDGSVNLAIAIRSFVSKQNILYYQAGAGIVIRSNEEKELQEVTNKLAALKKALILAENI